MKCFYDKVIIYSNRFFIGSLESAYNFLLSKTRGEGGFVCFVNVHSFIESTVNEELRLSLHESLVNMPDGKPIAHLLSKNYSDVEAIPGPDLLNYFIEECNNKKHFFYGSEPEVLEKLVNRVTSKNPSFEIVGYISPPFRLLTDMEKESHINIMKKSDADFIWIGLGCPKQEIWMLNNYKELKPSILLGVGAAFDFTAGVKKRAPIIMQRLSLEWLFRLTNEPKRLAKRYLYTNLKFLILLISNSINVIKK